MGKQAELVLKKIRENNAKGHRPKRKDAEHTQQKKEELSGVGKPK